MLEKIANPLGFSQSLGVPRSSSSRASRDLQRPPGRPGRIAGDKIPSRDNTVSDLVGGLLEREFTAAPEGWPRLAILMLLGTGMRVGELCSLTLEDIEDEGDAAFLKIRRGKGAKFRRAPISRRLRRELVRYLNRVRPDTSTQALLVRQD